MKLLFIAFLVCLVSSLGVATRFEEAQACSPTVCLLNNTCVCASGSSPLTANQTPQFVVLTSDDALTDYIYSTFYQPLLTGRTNPDGNNISGTIFIPHEYTDYERVNDIYNAGFEVGVNSISKNSLSSYWAEADVETLVQEFGGARELVSYFANIPLEEIKGARTPNLQLNGNITFEAYSLSNITYDHSWPTLSSIPLFPYTLDYLTIQNCSVGNCPNESFPGIWVLPIVNIQGANNSECSILLGCQMEGTEEELYQWLKTQFERSYNNSRAPVSLLFNAGFFQSVANSSTAVSRLLDYLGTLDDVFIVSASQVIQWRANPVPVQSYSSSVGNRSASCVPRTCVLSFGETEIRYMKSCVACPAVYPWLGNPKGEPSV